MKTNEEKLATAKEYAIDSLEHDDMDTFLMITLKDHGNQGNIGYLGAGTPALYAKMIHRFLIDNSSVMEELEALVDSKILEVLKDD